MKKMKYFSMVALATAVVGLVGCGAGKDRPGHVYMPDMGESRAFEAYIAHDSSIVTRDHNKLGGKAFFYNGMPVKGTISIGEDMPYTLPFDSVGYRMSASVENPHKDMSVIEMPEAQRLWQINCAICHGDKGTGDGPLSTAGKVGGVANLTLPIYVDMTDGTMFHSITHGKGVMGSYASQMSKRERWMVINFIRTLQPKGGSTADAAAADTTKKG